MGFAIISRDEVQVGTPIVRSSGILQGYTTPPQGASGPSIAFNVTGSFGVDTLTIQSDVAADIIFNFTAVDPMLGGNTVWIDTSSGDKYAVAGLFVSALDTVFGSTVIINVDGEDASYVQVSRNAIGASTHLQIINLASDLISVQNPGGYGTDAVTGSGQITEVILIPKATGKTIKLTDIVTNGVGVIAMIRFAFKNASGTYFRICQEIYHGGYSEPSRAGYVSEWLNGRTDCDLVAYLTSIPTGGSVTCYAFAEQY
jgi:hypothetical protein